MNTVKKKNSIPLVTGCHRMTWRELAEADDLASSLTVDAMLGFVTHKMTEMRLRITERLRAKFKEIITSFQKHKCYDTAYEQLTADSNIIKRSWRSDCRFKEHVFRYLLLFDDRSGVEIRPCKRYASENHIGAAIFASKDWPKGSRINSLVGCIAELNLTEERSFLQHRKNDFSVMYSSRKNCSQLWLGPAAYVNHDCQPNCEFTINCDGDAQMSLEAKTDIKKGDEIFIFYGKHFFDVNNSACECFTCELLGRGYFSKFVKDLSTEPTSVQLGTSPLRCLTNQVDRARNAIGQADAVESPRSSASLKPELVRPVNDDLPREVAQIFSTLPWDGALPKGSSAGLACRSLSTAYSLRHTGTRLNRVKARLRAATEAARKESITDQESDVQKGRNQSRPTPVHVTKPQVIRERTGCPRTVRRSIAPQRRRPTMWLRSTPVDESTANSNSTTYLSCDSLLDPCRVKPHGERKIGSLSVIAVMPNADRDEFLSPIADDPSSPSPPQLDRASSIDSVSMPSQLSTAATTPDPQSGYYNGLVESQLPMPTLRMGSQYEEVPGSVYESQSSSGNTSSTSPACVVEPILDRLFSETRSMESSFSNNSDSTPTKRTLKRLTNYDARLIAEANLLPPIPDRRRRRRCVQEDRTTINTNNNRYFRSASKRPSRSMNSASVSKRWNRSLVGSIRETTDHRISPIKICATPDAPSQPLRKRSHYELKHSSMNSFVHLTSSPNDLSPHPLSEYRTSCLLETVPDSTSELTSEPPQIYPVSNAESDDARTISHGAVVAPYFLSDADQSCSTTPLRTDPMDDSDLSGDAVDASHGCSFTSYSTEPLDYIYTDHDYIRHTVQKATQQEETEFIPSHKTSRPDVQFLTSTPPPPILHPATPVLDRLDPTTSPQVRASVLSSHEHPAFPQAASKSCSTLEQAAFWTVSNPIKPVKSSGRHIISFEQRLTVTLKRIGPQSYQISRPGRVSVSQ